MPNKREDKKAKVAAAELKKARAEAEANLAGWKRAKADFDNFKKKSAEENTAFRKYANEDFALQILPVADNCASAYDTLPEEKADDPWAKGIKYIKDQLDTVMREVGIEEIPSLGREFDPEVHEAVEGKEKVKGKTKVSKVLVKGYTLNGKVIRPVKVKVK